MDMKTRQQPASPPKEPGIEALQAIVERSGVVLSALKLQQLWTYHQLLRDHNAQLNLTRIHNFTNMVLKLYVDSILPAQMVELPSPLLDLGTGQIGRAHV